MSAKLEIFLNLRVLPIEVLDNIASQKCLISKQIFPKDLRPGSWVKCMRNDGAFTVCQVFPRDISQKCCYLDRSVSNIEVTSKHLSKTGELKSLHLLRKFNNKVEEIKVILVVTEKLFRSNVDKITLKQLQQSIKVLMQSMHLISDCIVRIAELKKTGVAAIHIQSSKGLTDLSANDVFQITDDTIITITDVKLFSKWLTAEPFYPYGFEKPQQDFNDLLQVAEIQKHNTKCKFKLTLNALFTGCTGCGKSALAISLIKKFGINCFRIRSSDILGQYPGETESELRILFKSAKDFAYKLKPKAPTMILLEDLQLLCPVVKLTDAVDAGNAMRICAQLLSLVDELHQHDSNIICLATSSAPDSINEVARRAGRFEYEINIASPTDIERRQLFAALFQDSYIAKSVGIKLSSNVLNLITFHTQGYVVADLCLLLRTIEQLIFNAGESSDLETAVKAALTKSQPMSIRGADVSVLKMTRGFNTIGGMQHLKRSLEVSVLAALNRGAAFERFGLNLPKGILLYGPPGCAKTTIAKCLAKEANCNLICTSGAEVYSPYVGCAERFIAKIFDTARRHAPCVIFLDEIDTLVGRRAMAANALSCMQVRILSTLLTEMDGIMSATNAKHILVVAATNRPDMLDDALLRPGRFDKLIHVPAPDCHSRLSLLQLFAQRMPISDDVNLIAIAERTHNYSGADICNLCNEAALQALQHNFNVSQITVQHFESVMASQKSSLTQRQIDWYENFARKYIVTHHNPVQNN